MIGTRVATTIALLLSVAALALAVVAFMATIRDEEMQPGRLVDTRVGSSYTGGPVLFQIDDFYMSRDGSGTLHALYVYPPGYSGHTRGCRVVWDDADTVEFGEETIGPGVFIDPCRGARFDRDGTLVAGPADRGLDYFEMEAGIDGYVVDTRTLFCGPPYEPAEPEQATPEPTVTRTATPTAPALPTGTTATATTTVSPTVTRTPTATRTSAVDVATETPEPEECDRVTNESRRR